MDLNNLITAGALGLIGFGLISVSGLLKPKDIEYEGGEGEKIPPPDEREKDPNDKNPPPRDPCKSGTKPLGCDCKATSECSATGEPGGRSANLLDRVSCDGGRCEYHRQDWANVWYPPSQCVGQLFGQKGTCNKSYEEDGIRKRLGWN